MEKQVVTSTFDPADVRIEWFSGTGKGGQHRNKHQNSCRAFHTPTGLSAKAECRSRSDSLTTAMTELRRRVDVENGGQKAEEDADVRRTQVGSGMRGDKIRTYRLQDDSVVDHRTERRATWRQIERGEFDRL